jgi:chemotaxis response regulator CheB
MPKAAAEEGLADKITDLENISCEIENFNYNLKDK